jgi:enoyl-CoA hydratase
MAAPTPSALTGAAKGDGVEVRRDGHVLRVTLARPDRLNALTAAMLRRIASIAEATADLDSPVRAMILTGVGGRAFSSGADLSEIAVGSAAAGRALGETAHAAMNALEAAPVPVIACVDGYALGGGCELALACDWILATRQSTFGQPETALGLIPGFGGTVRLAERIGTAGARRLILRGDSITAEEAGRRGLVDELFDDREALLRAAHAEASAIAARPRTATAAAKAQLGVARRLPRVDALASEIAAYAAAFETPQARDGVAAFRTRPRSTG